MAQAVNEQMRASHILKKHEKSRNPVSRNPSFSNVDIKSRSVADAEKMLADILADINSYKDENSRIQRFLELASKESDCGSYKKGGDLGSFGYEQMQKQFSDATSKLNINEMTQNAVLSDSGSHLILRLPLNFKNPFDKLTQVRASHILVKHKESRRQASWKDPNGVEIKKRSVDEADKILQGFLDEILKIQDVNQRLQLFSKIASKESDCGSAQDNGNLGYFTFEKMQKPFSEASFALDIGEISGIVHSASGSHIIMRTG